MLHPPRWQHSVPGSRRVIKRTFGKKGVIRPSGPSARCLVTAPTGGADLGIGDLVGQQCVDLGGLGGGVAEAAAYDLDGHAAVDQLGGVRVAELVDADPGTGGLVLLPPAVRRVIR